MVEGLAKVLKWGQLWELPFLPPFPSPALVAPEREKTAKCSHSRCLFSSLPFVYSGQQHWASMPTLCHLPQ